MNKLTQYLVEGILGKSTVGIVVLFPGGFKPPTGGHLNLAKRYASQPNVSQVNILIGPKEREGITREQSEQVWKALLVGTTNISTISVAQDNPLLAAYKYIEKAKPGTYALAASNKGEDYERVKKFVQGHAVGAKYNRKGVVVVEMPMNVTPASYKERKDNFNGKGISATVLRKDIADRNFDNFKTNYPETAVNTVKSIYDMLVPKKLVKENSIDSLVTSFSKNIKKIIASVQIESQETKEAFKLILLASQGKKTLTAEEKKQIGDQMKDVLKTVGLATAAVLPGGTIYFILIRVLRLEKYTMPSSFMPSSHEPSSYQRSSSTSEGVMLYEGGAAGHLAHPYEDYDLTFSDMQNMISAALGGTVEAAQEKLDGQNLMVTYKDGKVKAARNKGHIKDFAANSLTVAQVKQTFAGRGPIQGAFSEAMVDLESAISMLSKPQKEKFFANGSKFLNLEVLYPETVNVVPYGATQLRIHHIKEYDKAGNVIGEDIESAQAFEGALRQVEAQNQKTYEIKITDPVTIKKSADFAKQKEELLKVLKDIVTKYKLKMDDKLGLYFQAWWKEYITNIGKQYGYVIEDNTLQQLINRWAFGNKQTNIRVIRDAITNEDFKTWAVEFDKRDYAMQNKIAARPIENLFLKLGVYTLSNIENLVSLNPNNSVRQMKKDLKSAVNQIKVSGKTDANALDFLKRELTRLKDIGGYNAILPTEGIVFKYNGKLFKLTGAFAPMNMLIGYLKY